MSSKRYIPILITIALLALIALQGIWLFMVYKHKAQELKDKTREAVLETTKRLQQEEDSKYIIRNIDSLLVTENIIGSENGPAMRVIVSNIKNKFRLDTLKIEEAEQLQQKININGDTSTATTIVNIRNGKKQKIVIHSGTLEVTEEKKHEGIDASIEKSYEAAGKAHDDAEKAARDAEKAAKVLEEQVKVIEKQKQDLEKVSVHVKKKAGDLQALFLKMALNSKQQPGDVHAMVNSDHLKRLLQEELEKRGIDLVPHVTLSGSAIETKDISKQQNNSLHSSAETDEANWNLHHVLRLPLFPDDLFGNGAFIEVGLKSTANFLIRQMAGLLSLSLFITVLIGVIMIYLFRRMLSQEKLHHMKNDFINNMTHELKTPIATISLAVDAINNPSVKNDEEKFRNYTDILKEENKKLNTHVERVLQMAELDKGEMAPEKKLLDLKTILENYISSYQLQIQSRTAKVNLNIQDIIIVEGDEFHLMNVFTNLLDNSLKYSGSDPVITITAYKNANHAEIHFIDNGIGIDKMEQEKIFDKFYRVQSGDLHDVKGFGLGLSYVRSIIEAHGGTIELKSEKNKGSEFIIKLKTHEA